MYLTNSDNLYTSDSHHTLRCHLLVSMDISLKIVDIRH